MSCPGDNYVVPGANPCAGGGGGVAGITSINAAEGIAGNVNLVSVDNSLSIFKQTEGQINLEISEFTGIRQINALFGINNQVDLVSPDNSITITGVTQGELSLTAVPDGVQTINSLQPDDGNFVLQSADSSIVFTNPSYGVLNLAVPHPTGAFFKNLTQNVPTGESVVIFTNTQDWAVPNYITATSGTLFTCAFSGVYQLLFNLVVVNSTATWTDTLKIATILHTRSGAGSARITAQVNAATGAGYEIQVPVLLKLIVGDTLQFLTAGDLTAGTVNVVSNSGLDFNTTFGWTLIKPV